MERSQDERDALRELAALLPREERDIMIQLTLCQVSAAPCLKVILKFRVQQDLDFSFRQ